MRVVIQRVSHASVTVDESVTGEIRAGLLVFAGFEDSDTIEDIAWISGKISQMRIFNDDKGIMNLGVKDVDADILLVSQFTLHASTKKGNRPSYSRAAKSEKALALYEQTIAQIQTDLGRNIQTGIFGADMKVELLNDGPVTIIMDSRNKE
jgi:D-tyrosyl-tRNA(Tyr) deacylase